MWGRDIRVPFDEQHRTRGIGELPWGEARCCPLTFFFEATCSREDSRACRRAKMGLSTQEGHSLHGGRDIHVPFNGKHLVGGMSEPLG